ncbi:acyl-CoA thioesterase II [Pseudokineococcus basanitobsidens]|uniref:Acyl-CoA thioesterase II n=1 Tax=Pseudokineococcus basanitobsidens TaxID=1926649 RepID=A0ABU8RJU6_9ACTN
MPDADGPPTPPDGREAPPPGESLRRLLAVLDLSSEGLDDRGQDLFSGGSLPQPHGRVFGGQVLAQSVVAASRTIGDEPAGGDERADGQGAVGPESRPLHSLHGYFLRAGDSSRPITFAVERLRDGRSFSARRVHALQADRPILSMIASFQAPADGADRQDAAPDVPGPEDLPATADVLGTDDAPAAWRAPDGTPGDASGADLRAWARSWVRSRPVELRHVPVDALPPGDGQAVWLRAGERLPDDPVLHRAVLAFASDDSLLEPVLTGQGLTWASRGVRVASLDHAMWWHRPARADEWLLYRQRSPSASSDRGLATGSLFRRDGVLAATVAQEGMVRVPRRR